MPTKSTPGMKMKCAAVIEERGLLSRAAVSAASRDRLFEFGDTRFDAGLAPPAEEHEYEQEPPHQEVSGNQQRRRASGLPTSLHRHDLRGARAGVGKRGGGR